MRVLSCILACEGESDGWFLPPLLQRAIDDLCLDRFPGTVDVRDIRRISADVQKPAEVVAASCAERGAFDVLLYHHDGYPRQIADEKIDEVVRALGAAGVGEAFVPVVPVMETEAWMLADCDALARVISASRAAVAAELPPQARLVEKQEQPKEALRRVIRSTVRRHRRARPDSDDMRRYFAALAEEIDIGLLRDVPAFARWWNDMATALDRLGYRHG